MTLRRVLRTLPWETDMDLIRAFSFGVLIGLGILGVVVVVTLSSPRIANPTTSPQPAASLRGTLGSNVGAAEAQRRIIADRQYWTANIAGRP